VVVRGLLNEAETATLTREVTAALNAAFGGSGPDRSYTEGLGGIRGDYLPLSVDRAPLSQSLIADDPRLFQGSAALLGRPTVPTAPIATCFVSNAGWHTDQGPQVGGVKFLAHLQRRTAGTGALRVVPGSQDPAFAERVRGYWSKDPALQGFDGWPVPGVVLETEPGDVIAFDLHRYHSSAGGDRRLAWRIEYLPWPGLADPQRLRLVRDLVVDTVDFDHEGYDRQRWPTWREWAAGARAVPSRQVAVERLRLLGVRGEGDPR
jgi:hypothetical protein